jgi:hypothetical protein
MLVVLGVVLLIPFSIIQRFRAGTARRQARRWVATINLGGAVASMMVLFAGAAIANWWVPSALTYTGAGFGFGCCLGALATALTRWEHGERHMHYTPNRWLVLIVTVIVALRLAYGFWRTWDAWRASVEHGGWVAASGAAGSMSAGAVVLGYYIVFWLGVRRRIRRREVRSRGRSG